MIERKKKDNLKIYTVEDDQIEDNMNKLGDTFKTFNRNSQVHGKKIQKKKEDYDNKTEAFDNKKEDFKSADIRGSYGSTLFSR